MTCAAPAGRGAPTAGLANRLPSLTGLRWIAALLVFGFHAGTMRIVAEPDYRAVVDALFTLGSRPATAAKRGARHRTPIGVR